jgi:hypothetical protein
MSATKTRLVTGAVLLGTGVLATRALVPKLHEHCHQMCADSRGGEDKEEARERKCPPKAACHAA